MNRYRYNDKWSNPSDRFDLYYVDPELAARVSALVNDFNLRIVSTSTWRCGKTVDEFKELLNNRFLPGDRLIGFTPDGEYPIINGEKGLITNMYVRRFTESSGSTGKQKLVDTGGRVEKFNRRFNRK